MKKNNPAALVATGLAALLLAACSGGEAPPAAEAPASSADTGPLETRERNGIDYQPAFAGQTRAPGVRNGRRGVAKSRVSAHPLGLSYDPIEAAEPGQFRPCPLLLGLRLLDRRDLGLDNRPLGSQRLSDLWIRVGNIAVRRRRRQPVLLGHGIANALHALGYAS